MKFKIDDETWNTITQIFVFGGLLHDDLYGRSPEGNIVALEMDNMQIYGKGHAIRPGVSLFVMKDASTSAAFNVITGPHNDLHIFKMLNEKYVEVADQKLRFLSEHGVVSFASPITGKPLNTLNDLKLYSNLDLSEAELAYAIHEFYEFFEQFSEDILDKHQSMMQITAETETIHKLTSSAKESFDPQSFGALIELVPPAKRDAVATRFLLCHFLSENDVK